MFFIENKRKKPQNILKVYPDAIIIDVTSKAEGNRVKLSPFYPHGGIPVPFNEGLTARCVEAIYTDNDFSHVILFPEAWKKDYTGTLV